MRGEQPLPQRPELVAGDDHVAQREPGDAGHGQREPVRSALNPRAPGYRVLDQLDELPVRPALRPGGVERHVVRPLAGLDRQACDIGHRDGLDVEPSVTGDEEHRHPAQRPGDVVDEDVAGPVRERGPDDRVRRGGSANEILRLGLAAEVRGTATCAPHWPR